jgi:hypothetical protein
MARQRTRERIVSFRVSEDEYRILADFRRTHGFSSTTVAVRAALERFMQDPLSHVILERINEALSLLQQLKATTDQLAEMKWTHGESGPRQA